MMGVFGQADVLDASLSLSRIFIVEEHHAAYQIWREQGVKDAVLLHFDGHLDFVWMAERDPLQMLRAFDRFESRVTGAWNTRLRSGVSQINPANFLYPAIRDGMFRIVYWVVPDVVWDNVRQRRWIGKIFSRLREMEPYRSGPVRWEPDKISFVLMGVCVVALKLSVLPLQSQGRICLDIDTDYLLTRRLETTGPYFSQPDISPWIQPEAFMDRLRIKVPLYEIATIAYSVDGGYTPLRWKHFGDELSVLMKGEKSSEASAARHFEQYLRYKKNRQLLQAGLSLKSAVEQDAGYLSLYNNDALRLFYQKKWRAAEKELRWVLDLFPGYIPYQTLLGQTLMMLGQDESARRVFCAVADNDQADARLWANLAWLSYKAGDWNLARDQARRALDRDGYVSLAWETLARLCHRQRDFRRGAEYFQRLVAIEPSVSAYTGLILCHARVGNHLKMKEKVLDFLGFFLRRR